MQVVQASHEILFVILIQMEQILYCRNFQFLFHYHCCQHRNCSTNGRKKNVEMAARQRNCLAKEVRRQMCSKITLHVTFILTNLLMSNMCLPDSCPFN